MDAGQLRRYSLYAFGEIALVVIGILIALYINKHQVRINQENEFNKGVEQLYNALKIEQEWLKVSINSVEWQLDIIDSLLVDPSTFDPKKIIHLLGYLDFYMEPYNTELDYLSKSLSVSSQNHKQKEIAMQVSSYANNILWDINNPANHHLEIPKMYTFLKNYNIPDFEVGWIMNKEDFYKHIDTSFYWGEEIDLVMEGMKDASFNALIRSMRSNKRDYLVALRSRMTDASSISDMLKNTVPSVQFLFDDLGIIGSALQTDWESSIPMELVDQSKSIWQITVELEEGVIKFRNRDSWNHNWGGNTFPRGATIFFGQDIKVKPGKYNITLNLTEDYYTFEPVE